ncbi:MAG: acetate kinase, partial [Anaerolineae bacterium]|nr:acetate kinase [Anaerolineae bacterium]
MNILIFNCGSSSQGFKVYQCKSGQKENVLITGKAKNVATQTRAEAVIDWKMGDKSESKITDLSSHRLAAENILEILRKTHIEVDAIGHRIVHGGPDFVRTEKVDERVMDELRHILHYAPIHNPNSYSVIEVCREKLPGKTQFVVFDTAFHAGMPPVSRFYAIPRDLAKKHGYYKYGFHGLSYQFISARMAELFGKPLESLKLIMCHLGTGGSSVVAFKDGRSLDTSMGYTPLQGLVMSTRCGDIDAEV